METVILKNGAEEVKSLVKATMLSLRALTVKNFSIFYDLVTLCRNPTYQPSGHAKEELEALGFVNSDGSVDERIRNIVLSTAEGDNSDMTFSSPIK